MSFAVEEGEVAKQAVVIAVDRTRKAPLHAVSTTARRVVAIGSRLAIEADRAGTYRTTLSDGRTVSTRVGTLPAPIAPSTWDLHVQRFTPTGSPTIDVKLTDLSDWRNIEQLQRAAGTGTYKTTVNLPAGWLTARRGVALSLGTLEGASEVAINGTLATKVPVRLPDERLDIGRLLHAGKNTITVRLATPPLNELIGLANDGDASYAAFLQSTPVATGLIGPVKLTAYKVAVLPRSTAGPR